MKLATGMERIAQGWIVKPKGFRVRFEQIRDNERVTGYSPPLEDNYLDSDVTCWRYAWKLAMASQPRGEVLEEGDLVNVTVVNDSNDPIAYYATGQNEIFNPYGEES